MKRHQLLVISGGDDEGLNMNEEVCIYDKSHLNSFVEHIQIGDVKKGFKSDTLSQLIKDKIDPDKKEFDVLVIMHGGLSKHNKYELQCYYDADNIDNIIQELITVKKFFEILTKATNGAKNNVYFVSCFGANIIEEIENLSIGSKVITLSDKDKESNILEDTYIDPKITASLVKNIFSQNFKLEYFLELHCFNQKLHNNTPNIAVITEIGVEIVNFEKVKQNYIKSSYTYSPFIEKMFELGIFSKDKFDFTHNKFKNCSLDEIKPPHNLKSTFFEHHKNGTLETLKQQWEDEYYFVGDFKNTPWDLSDGIDKMCADNMSTPAMYFAPSDDIIDKIMSQHSIALGLLIDYAINNNEL